MANAEMSPRLRKLVDRLAGSYPSASGNEILPQFIADSEPEEVGELFTQAFTLFRQAVDAEHEKNLQEHPFGVSLAISRETAQLGHVADALLNYLDAAGVEMYLAVRETAVEAYMAHHDYDKKTIQKYAGESDGYYRFYTNIAWSDKPAILFRFMGDSGKVFFSNHSGAFASFDVRDVYMVGVRY